MRARRNSREPRNAFHREIAVKNVSLGIFDPSLGIFDPAKCRRNPDFWGGFPPKPRSVLRNRQGILRLSGVSSRAHEGETRGATIQPADQLPSHGQQPLDRKSPIQVSKLSVPGKRHRLRGSTRHLITSLGFTSPPDPTHPQVQDGLTPARTISFQAGNVLGLEAQKGKRPGVPRCRKHRYRPAASKLGPT